MVPCRLADADTGETLAEQAYAALEELIVTLALPPGGTVGEAMLSARLGIGRTPVREALHRLAREHLVVILPRRGILVAPIDVDAQLRLLDVRREVERLVARLAARCADSGERARFAATAARMLAASDQGDETAFLRLDRAFNRDLLAAARNEFAANAMGLMHGLSRRFWYRHWRSSGDLPLAARLHADLSRAVASGDADEAAAADDRLLDYIADFTRIAR